MGTLSENNSIKETLRPFWETITLKGKLPDGGKSADDFTQIKKTCEGTADLRSASDV
jgi:hypothetical protein